jgi:hypothetical protein
MGVMEEREFKKLDEDHEKLVGFMEMETNPYREVRKASKQSSTEAMTNCGIFARL